ncbi:YitT family protein [Ideonella sp. A 288]|uniref:YitT family protein n=1 Tax=Ideonella sp. A 288 TaxID=1962181 RepID=UPI000B4AD55A|nr:YitT family protein [Ideonella sp. A 288]
MSPGPAAQALEPQRHSLFDDVQGLATGTLFVAFGLMLFRQAGLLTGGTAGIALVLHYAMGLPFGALFFAINLPFYWLAWRRMGARFTLKTFAAVSLLALLSEWMPRWIGLSHIEPLFAALGGGLLLGAGFIILFRHRASLGGLNVLVLWLQDRFGWRAGWMQMGIDVTILLASVPWLDVRHLALSIAGALAMNFALAVNHKPGRYTAF